LKPVLLRNIPELQAELGPVINAFDPWARDRDGYYSLQWRLRPDAWYYYVEYRVSMRCWLTADGLSCAAS
jgi:hypothetical protein